jgi:large repetitive protein
MTINTTFFRRLYCCLLVLACLGGLHSAQAQVIYSAGSTNNAGPFNQFFIVNGTTGLTAAPGVPNTLPAGITESAAIGVSPINGLVYWVERTVATPRFGTWDPATGATTIVGNAATPAGIASFIRATFCPDGRFYIAGNGSAGGAGAEIYQINPVNGALIRTLVITNVPTSGSGDIVCMSNGDMYVMAQSVGAGTPYQLYRITAAQVNTGGTFAANLQGNLNTPNTQAFNGLSERADGQILASVAFNTTANYVINTTTAVATTLTTVASAALVDLSREFPRDVSVTKTVTPTVALQGRTLTYVITASNAGPGVAASVTISDILNPAVFNVPLATWACSVVTAGSATAVTTACGAASGTGNVNTFANLSINSAVRYTVTAPLLSSFSGTVTNSVAATLTGTTVDPTPSNNFATVTSTVVPAVNLSVSKNNGTTTLVAGSTTAYTVTFANAGPGNGSGTIIRDSPSAGLSCTTVTCVSTTGGASCPVGLVLGTPTAISAIPNLFNATGIAINTFPGPSTVNLRVDCGVTASGQ